LDDIPTAQIPRFHDEWREHLKAEGTVLGTIRESGDISDETEEKLGAEIEKFKRGFAVEEETSLVA
ncbi:MAG: F0F1 ATP synthase subunit alpha, partial [Actinomycetota bacterium]|nr:F0F1 ATP synthase subunit alpha [Actinomycetota bacterium]